MEMPEGDRRRHQFYALWYFSIALGFALLAIYFHLRGGRPWLIGLRLLIAAAFALLGWLEWRRR